MDEHDNYICKNNGKVYVSNTDLDRINTYRNRKQAENMVSDKRYWEYRNIDIDAFKINYVELDFIKMEE